MTVFSLNMSFTGSFDNSKQSFFIQSFELDIFQDRISTLNKTTTINQHPCPVQVMKMVHVMFI